MENIAVDLLWLRPGKVGGTESYIRNLLDGLMELKENFKFTLLVSKDNYDTFQKYKQDKRYTLLVAEVFSANIMKRILWQNLHQNRLLRNHGIKKCFEPVYCKPWLNGGVEYVCVIHDLQAYHYPKYHPFHEVIYSRLCWRMDVWNAKKIVAISQWVKEDILSKYIRKKEDIHVIYNPIYVSKEEVYDFDSIKKKFNVEDKGFYYTVSQLIPHKNLKTLIKVIDVIKNENRFPNKLLISGVNGSAVEEIKALVKEKKLEDNIILTGYIENRERNTLYKTCKAFLYPSIFEGFGMPPLEAMLFGAMVITTRCASIPEVTQGKANYVEDPYNVNEWINVMENADNRSDEVDFKRYNLEVIAHKYLYFLQEAFSEE